ncbi:MAG: DNA (cytosine-5-)-methyltransferase [Fusobacteriaceae bacterium]
MEKKIVELFAGVGGFRIGFEKANPDWETVFMSQWEPGKKNQFAFNCYKEHFENAGGVTEFSNCDISTVPTSEIPDCTVLVGGFPCQDYSVASTGAKGIQGKKGVLWWEIERILEDKKPAFLVLENVDRLLKSPSKQRGRDFGVILACLNRLGYGVEWRVINAAEYGFVQRRKRVFIFAFRNSTKYFESISKKDISRITYFDGIFAKRFHIKRDVDLNLIKESEISLSQDLQDVSDNFKYEFQNTGIMMHGKIYTVKAEPGTPVQEKVVLGDVIESGVDAKYYIDSADMPKWEYMKGPKAIPRTSKEGHEYMFREGGIAFPDPLDKPARTMLTSEASKNRSTHIIEDPETGRLRKLTPLECERINGFPDNWTNTGLTDANRYFCMGNALVVNVVKELADEIGYIIDSEE